MHMLINAVESKCMATSKDCVNAGFMARLVVLLMQMQMIEGTQLEATRVILSVIKSW